ncbi:MAG: leucine-rich repeat domain-containing protein [Candidatus Latescibacterota bacterium]|jgi:Tol biopolymer transport system component
MPARSTTLLIIAIACAVLTGCGDDSAPSAPQDDTHSVSPSQPTAAFADSNLEAAIRTALGQLTGPLAADTLLSLEQLSARDRGIVGLGGIEQLQHLETLDLADNEIADLTPVAGLARLVFLDITANQIQDLSPLAELDSLQSLALAFNPIRDLAPLLGLARLQWLEVLGAPLSQNAQEYQLPALQQRGVQIAQSPVSTEVQSQRPDNQTRIAFISKQGIPDGDHGYRLYTVHPDGSDLKKVNDLLFDRQPVFSPQEDRLVFDYDADFTGPTPSDIYVARTDGSDLRNLTEDRTLKLLRTRGICYEPFWSPNGDQVGFLAGSDRLIMDVVGGTPRFFFQRDQVEMRGSAVSISHQWGRVAFLSGQGAKVGTRTLYVSGIDETEWTLVVDAVVDVKAAEYSTSYISWSPDDQKIAFISNRDGNRELYVVNVDGSNLTRLTNDDSVDAASIWSPDGRWLAFDTNREVKWEVFVVDIEGKNTYNLTQDFAEDHICGWLDGE